MAFVNVDAEDNLVLYEFDNLAQRKFLRFNIASVTYCLCLILHLNLVRVLMNIFFNLKIRFRIGWYNLPIFVLIGVTGFFCCCYSKTSADGTSNHRRWKIISNAAGYLYGMIPICHRWVLEYEHFVLLLLFAHQRFAASRIASAKLLVISSKRLSCLSHSCCQKQTFFLPIELLIKHLPWVLENLYSCALKSLKQLNDLSFTEFAAATFKV